MMKWIKKLLCRYFDQKWVIYVYRLRMDLDSKN